jgi:hypothetical protein
MESNEDNMDIEVECLEFLNNCSVDDFAALYEYMTLTKIEEVETDTLELKYVIVESEADEEDVGKELSFEKMVEGVEAVFNMTQDDVKLLYVKINEIKKAHR